jgi:hypothetical protein
MIYLLVHLQRKIYVPTYFNLSPCCILSGYAKDGTRNGQVKEMSQFLGRHRIMGGHTRDPRDNGFTRGIKAISTRLSDSPAE